VSRSLVFDVESVGLHGEGFAVGWVVVVDDKIVEEDWCACAHAKAKGTPEGRIWVKENVPSTVLSIDRFHVRPSPRQVRDSFWEVWERERDLGATLWADCLWPVEARFVIACIEDNRTNAPLGEANLAYCIREWDGPYPFHEIATLRRAAGLAGGVVSSHNSRAAVEKPIHHPLTDAKQSARLLVEAQRILRGLGSPDV